MDNSNRVALVYFERDFPSKKISLSFFLHFLVVFFEPFSHAANFTLQRQLPKKKTKAESFFPRPPPPPPTSPPPKKKLPDEKKSWKWNEEEEEEKETRNFQALFSFLPPPSFLLSCVDCALVLFIARQLPLPPPFRSIYRYCGMQPASDPPSHIRNSDEVQSPSSAF